MKGLVIIPIIIIIIIIMIIYKHSARNFFENIYTTSERKLSHLKIGNYFGNNYHGIYGY